MKIPMMPMAVVVAAGLALPGAADADAAAGDGPIVVGGGCKTVIESKGAGRITVEVEDAPAQAAVARKVAVVVQNHAPGMAAVPPGKVADMFTAALSGRGFGAVVPDNSIGATQNRHKAGEAMPAASAISLGREGGAGRAEGELT